MRSDRAVGQGEIIRFHCNVCSAANTKSYEQMDREKPSCDHCDSNVRFRWIVHAVSEALGDRSLPLKRFPVRKDISGLGLSDWEGYAGPLARCFNYTNTFFHTEPRLDIGNLPEDRKGRYDFVIATEVLEHVVPPVDAALVNLCQLLKPNGIAFITVPWIGDVTQEHYPDLFDYQIVQKNCRWQVHNRTRDGRMEVFEDPVFHGGPGTTLEMRLFSGADLVRRLEKAGFAKVEICRPTVREYGIIFQETWSLPMIAYKSPR
ncbi:MAG: methyltransferase domain-containing protein [Bryobacteraceae bacterium]